MPLGSFGNVPGANPSPQELSEAFARLLKEVDYLLNGGLDTLNVNELSADVINAGVLNAALVTVKAALTGAAFIQLSGQGIKINDGTKDTFVADVNGLITLVGALFQTVAGDFPRLEINSGSNLLGAYKSLTEYIALNPNLTGTPTLQFKAGSLEALLSFISTTYSILVTAGDGAYQVQNGKLILGASTDVNLAPTGNLQVNGTSGFTGTFTAGTSTITVKKGIITSVI